MFPRASQARKSVMVRLFLVDFSIQVTGMNSELLSSNYNRTNAMAVQRKFKVYFIVYCERVINNEN